MNSIMYKYLYCKVTVNKVDIYEITFCASKRYMLGLSPIQSAEADRPWLRSDETYTHTHTHTFPRLSMAGKMDSTSRVFIQAY